MDYPEDCAELLKQCDEHMVKLRSPEAQARMIADGRDPEAVLREMAAARDTLLAANQKCEEDQEKSLHARADVADASYEAFKATRKSVQEYKQANPLDPRLEEWEDQLEAWAEQMPKEEPE